MSSWRFVSPVSYWDPRHYGSFVGVVECCWSFGGVVVLMTYYSHRSWRVIAGLVLLFSLVPVIYALSMWVG